MTSVCPKMRLLALLLAFLLSADAGAIAAQAKATPRPLARLSGAKARNPALQLRVEPDPESAGEVMLVVEYPAPSEDPAARDVWLDADIRNWSAARGITLQVKPSHPTRLSVSFFDRNRVIYTTWADLADTTWQTVQVRFDTVRPNPYFQPPDATTGAPLDLMEVSGLAFAPQDKEGGRLQLRRIYLNR